MTTTFDQWPRYEVFKQDRPGQPHRNVGSVHAPDAAVALMNARDVFARRPSCYSLWVVEDGAIVRRTAAQLAAEPPTNTAAELPRIPYAVCGKQSERQSMTYVDYLGLVEARTAAEALRLAVATFDHAEITIWWVFRESAITRSEEDDAAGFAAATSKLFRMPNQYRTVFTMQQIRRGGEDES